MAEKQKLLLHSCCGPCSSSVLERLIDDYDITIYYYNPNIYPREEYIRRKEEQIEYVNLRYNGLVKVIEADYENEKYEDLVKENTLDKEGGHRCELCFDLRLKKTAEYAKNHGFSLFTTTLTVSPHKNSPLIFKIANDIAKDVGVQFLEENFKKKNGYLRSVELSKEYDMYRQDYCGCKYSIRD